MPSNYIAYKQLYAMKKCIIPRQQSWFNLQKSINIIHHIGLPWQLSGKESACNAGDLRDVDSVPGLGRPPGKETGNPLQNSCLENPMDRGAWQARVHRVAMSWTRLKQLSSSSSRPQTESACTHAKLLQLYLTLRDPMDYSLLGFSVHGILQTRILEWFAMPSSRGSSQPRDRTYLSHVSCIVRLVLYHQCYVCTFKM